MYKAGQTVIYEDLLRGKIEGVIICKMKVTDSKGGYRIGDNMYFVLYDEKCCVDLALEEEIIEVVK